jgi:hypothetical protein
MTRVNLLENTWNFSPERHARIISFLDKGWGRVIYTLIYAFLILAIFYKYGKNFI